MAGRVRGQLRWMPTRCCALKTATGSQAGGSSFPKSRRIRVERSTHIPISMDKLWGLVEEVSGANWKEVKPVLGALECVFRIEYQLEGERVIRALQDANELPIITDDVHDAQQKVLAIFPFLESFWNDSESTPNTERMKELSTKAHVADIKFIDGLLKLLRKSHFCPLDVRDVALSKSLNSDYLTQLFIKGNSRILDSELTSVAMNDELPMEARDMLVFKRGYGVQADTGRWILQKLDYIQLLTVQACFAAFKNAIKYARNVAETTSRRLGAYLSDGPLNGPDVCIEDFDTFMSNKAIVDTKTWRKIKDIGKDAVISMNELGIPLKVMSMGGGILVTLVDRGYLPQIDVTPLESFEEVWPVKERGKQDPIELQRSGLVDSIGSAFSTGNLPDIFKPVELKQPTFERLLVVYRCKTQRSLLKLLQRAFANEPTAPEPHIRQEIQLRVYNKIPISLWKAAFPEKLLQFRLLDVIRLDLFTVIGLAAVVAQAKYSSILLDIATFASLGIFATRVLLGYKRMYDRFDNLMNELLSKKTIAGQDGALVYLASSAAVQQYKQCALAYALLVSSKKNLSPEALGMVVEDALMSRLAQVSFPCQEALSELERLELVKSVKVGDEKRYLAVGTKTGMAKIRRRWNDMFTERTLEPN